MRPLSSLRCDFVPQLHLFHTTEESRWLGSDAKKRKCLVYISIVILQNKKFV